jgi:N-acetylneuraminate lyase
MKKIPRLLGVKNSSMPVQDIQMWRDEDVLVFNGPGRAAALRAGGRRLRRHRRHLRRHAGAVSGHRIAASGPGDLEKGRVLQNEACRIIYRMCTADCNLYAVLKEIIRCGAAPTPGTSGGR